MVVRRGGSRRVGGRMVVRKDWNGSECVEEVPWHGPEAYGELPRTPEPFNDANMVDCHGGKEQLGGVCVAYLRSIL